MTVVFHWVSGENLSKNIFHQWHLEFQWLLRLNLSPKFFTNDCWNSNRYSDWICRNLYFSNVCSSSGPLYPGGLHAFHYVPTITINIPSIVPYLLSTANQYTSQSSNPMSKQYTTNNSDENRPRSYLDDILWDKLIETLKELARQESARTETEKDVSIDLSRLNAMDAGKW